MKKCLSIFLASIIILLLPINSFAFERITTTEALNVLKASIGLTTLSAEQIMRYGINGDIVTASDALRVLQMSIGNEIPINERRTDEMFNVPVEGVLENGIKYKFIPGDFNLNIFFERNKFNFSRDVDATIIARTPIEAAEKGLKYLGSIREDLFERFVVYVRYCSATDNWVLDLIYLDTNPSLVTGTPDIITINYSNGSVVRHFFGKGLSYNEIVW